MLAVFPQLSDLAVPYAWGGFVDISMNRAPDFGRIGKNIYYLQGYSGHGLILTGLAGKVVAEAIAGQAERFDAFFVLSGRFRCPAARGVTRVRRLDCALCTGPCPARDGGG